MIENALLTNVLQALATDDGVAEDHPEIVALANDPASVSALTTTLDKMGGHILWTDFWVAVSRLMTGASLDSVRCDTTVPRAAPCHASPCHVPPCHCATVPLCHAPPAPTAPPAPPTRPWPTPLTFYNRSLASAR